jgi:hypothetical protein
MVDRLPDDATLHRVYSEFMEMPGLRLTPRQAQRLWGLDERICSQLLSQLVDAKFLTVGPQGMYARRGDGLVALPPLRAARATLRGRPRDIKQAG